MKSCIKKIFAWILPGPTYTRLCAIRARRFIQGVEERQGLRALNQKYEASLGREVKTGPFKGLRYTPFTSNRHITQRLVGAYESELHGAVEQIIEFGPDKIIDVGCAEGYYAGGFALRCPETQVIAFDTDPWAVKALTLLCQENDLNNVTIKSYCSPDWLASHAGEGICILCDCEGFEFELFSESYAAAYQKTMLLVELHDEAPSSAHRLFKRFEATHDIQMIPSVPHQPDDYPFLSGLNEKERRLAIDDMRNEWQGWLYMVPKS